jgi:hypothetical protein
MRAAPEELEIIAAAVQDLLLPVPQQILLEGSLCAEFDRTLLLLLTPTIIDPARVHSPDRLPYDPKTIPPENFGR